MFGVAAQSVTSGGADDSAQVGRRLRSAREKQELSLRELARRLEISASALSQIETGKSRPSVKTLYAIVSELGLSMDELFAAPAPEPAATPAEAPPRPEEGNGAAAESARGPVMQRGDSRASLALDSGITWERLTADHDPDVDFLMTTLPPGQLVQRQRQTGPPQRSRVWPGAERSARSLGRVREVHAGPRRLLLVRVQRTTPPRQPG